MDLRGIKNLTIFSREVIFTEDSRLDLSAPDLDQDLNILPPGSDGDDGKHGVHGPTGELRGCRKFKATIFCPFFICGLCGSGPNVISVGVERYQIPEVYSLEIG